ncbi:Acidic endochitinase SP2, partial [Pseudolycoriella hygida]
MNAFLQITFLIAISKIGVGIETSRGQISSRADCWMSGCQPSTWAERGCFPANQWHAEGSEPCPGGDKFLCCGTGDPTTGAQISFDEFSNAIVSNGYPQSSQQQHNDFMQRLPDGLISTKEEAAMALAQYIHESAGLTEKRETRCVPDGCPGEYETPGCDVPGQRYFGRGYIQLTGCNNYRAASQALLGNDDLVNNADSVAADENLAWNTAFWFWKANVHGRPGVSDGLFGATTKAINGGLECGNGQNVEIAHKRFAMYGNVRSAFGLDGPGDERGDPVERGECSFYGAPGELPPGALTASGEVFDPNAMTAAHKTIPFGRSIRVMNEQTGQTVDVRINDRGPFREGRIVDLTYAAFGNIANHDVGVIPCSYVFI